MRIFEFQFSNECMNYIRKRVRKEQRKNSVSIKVSSKQCILKLKLGAIRQKKMLSLNNNN